MNQKTSGAISGAAAGGSFGGGAGAAVGGVLGYLMGGDSESQDLTGNIVSSYRPMSTSTGSMARTWDTLNEDELQRAKRLDDFSDWGE